MHFVVSHFAVLIFVHSTEILFPRCIWNFENEGAKLILNGLSVTQKKKDFMIPAKIFNELSESGKNSDEFLLKRITLEKFERSKVLEIYFSRLDGLTPDDISGEYHELFFIELDYIKSFLLGQYPHDPLLQKIFKIMN